MATLIHIHLQRLYQKCPLVGCFFDDLVCRLACTMTGSGFDADQSRCGPGLAGLKLCCKLEAVAGDDAVVGVGSGYQCRGVLSAAFEIVVG